MFLDQAARLKTFCKLQFFHKVDVKYEFMLSSLDGRRKVAEIKLRHNTG